MEYYFEFLIFILTGIIILYKPEELVSLHDTRLGKFIMVVIVIILSLKSCLGGILGAIMFMTLATQKDIIEGACTGKNCKESTIPLANTNGKMCSFMCTLQYKRYGAGKCKEECADCCESSSGSEGFTGDGKLNDDESNNFEFLTGSNNNIIDDSDFGSIVKDHQKMGEGNSTEANYNKYLNKKMKLDKFQDNYDMKKKLYHKNKSIESDIKELEKNNKVHIERRKKLKNEMETKNKKLLQDELMNQIKVNTDKAASPIPKEIQERKLDDFLNSKFGKNNDLLSKVAALHGSNTRHSNGNIKTGMSMDIDEASGNIDGLIDNVSNMFTNGGMPLAQHPITDGGEGGLHSLLKGFI